MSKELFKSFSKSILDIEPQGYHSFTYQSPDVKVGLYSGDLRTLLKKCKCSGSGHDVPGQMFEVTGRVKSGEFHLGHITRGGSEPHNPIWFKPDLGENLHVTIHPYTGHFDSEFKSGLSPSVDVNASFNTEKKEYSISATKRVDCSGGAEMSFGVKHCEECAKKGCCCSSLPFCVFANTTARLPGGAKLTANYGNACDLDVSLSSKAGPVDLGVRCAASMCNVYDYLRNLGDQATGSSDSKVKGGDDGSCRASKGNRAILVAKVPISPANLVIVPKVKFPTCSAGLKISNLIPLKFGNVKNLMFALRVKSKDISKVCVSGVTVGSSFNISSIIPLGVRCSLRANPKDSGKLFELDALEGRMAFDLRVNKSLTASMYVGSTFKSGDGAGKSWFDQLSPPECFGVSLNLTKSD